MIDIDDSEIDKVPEDKDESSEASSERKTIFEALTARNSAEFIRGDAAIYKAEAEKAKLEAEELKKVAAEEKAKAAEEKAKAEELIEKYEGEERRKHEINEDRRQRQTTYDEEGNVKSKSYTGPDRRSGRDRRKEREELIRREHNKFLMRSATYAAIVGTVIISTSLTLFAPEAFKIKEFLTHLDYKAIAKKVSDSGISNISISATLNRYIGNVENYIEGVAEATKGIKSVGEGNATQDIAAIKGALHNIGSMHGASYEDKIAARNAAHNLKKVITNTLAGNPKEIKETLLKATDVNETTRTVLENSQSKSVAAAVLLFALNEFRDNIYSGNSYESDLTLIKKLAGDDPEMNAAINMLLPYAKSGVMSQEVLSAELKSLANDIVLAKIKGEDANVKQKALIRFEKLKQQARNKQLQGNNEEAVVARAQVMLDQGDVEGAMIELRRLKHFSNTDASEWINNASNSLAAGNSSEVIIQQLVKSAAGQSGISPKSLINMIAPGANRPIYMSPSR